MHLLRRIFPGTPAPPTYRQLRRDKKKFLFLLSRRPTHHSTAGNDHEQENDDIDPRFAHSFERRTASERLSHHGGRRRGYVSGRTSDREKCRQACSLSQPAAPIISQPLPPRMTRSGSDKEVMMCIYRIVDRNSRTVSSNNMDLAKKDTVICDVNFMNHVESIDNIRVFPMKCGETPFLHDFQPENGD